MRLLPVIAAGLCYHRSSSRVAVQQAAISRVRARRGPRACESQSLGVDLYRESFSVRSAPRRRSKSTTTAWPWTAAVCKRIGQRCVGARRVEIGLHGRQRHDQRPHTHAAQLRMMETTKSRSMVFQAALRWFPSRLARKSALGRPRLHRRQSKRNSCTLRQAASSGAGHDLSAAATQRPARL
jgi:hypothetical protein